MLLASGVALYVGFSAVGEKTFKVQHFQRHLVRLQLGSQCCAHLLVVREAQESHHPGDLVLTCP
jgi:hypothetical protein